MGDIYEAIKYLRENYPDKYVEAMELSGFTISKVKEKIENVENRKEHRDMESQNIDAANECLKALYCCIDKEGTCEFCPYGQMKYPECVKKLKDDATMYIQIHIPKKVKVENWTPNICPNCGQEIDEHMGDGYYSHPEYDRCPYCLQRLCY